MEISLSFKCAFPAPEKWTWNWGNETEFGIEGGTPRRANETSPHPSAGGILSRLMCSSPAELPVWEERSRHRSAPLRLRSPASPRRLLFASKEGGEEQLVCKQSVCAVTNSTESPDAAPAPRRFYS